MTYDIYIGIDPGVSGALAFIARGGRAVLHRTKTTLPIEAVNDALCGVDPRNAVAYIEQLTGFQAGRAAMRGAQVGVMMRNLGQWEGILTALQVRTVLVRPQTWQAGIPGLKAGQYTANKRAMKAEAWRRFPSVAPTLDTCDALLIADFGRRAEG